MKDFLPEVRSLSAGKVAAHVRVVRLSPLPQRIARQSPLPQCQRRIGVKDLLPEAAATIHGQTIPTVISIPDSPGRAVGSSHRCLPMLRPRVVATVQ